MMTEPSPIDLVRELREALGMFDGAMPITPKAAWEEAIERVRGLTEGRCHACMTKDATPWDGDDWPWPYGNPKVARR